MVARCRLRRVLTVVLFGATGSAGGSVLHACLSSPAVREVRAVTRRPLEVQHTRLTTITHADFEHYDAIRPTFANVDVCLYCLGKSVNQVEGEAAYRRVTHDFALAASRALALGSPSAIFHFVSASGAGLKSRFMWKRVKAETERDLLATASAVCWRPAAIDGMALAGEPTWYRALRPLYRLMKPARGLYVSGDDLGRAMLQATAEKIRGRIIENREIRDLADRSRALEQLDAIRHQ